MFMRGEAQSLNEIDSIYSFITLTDEEPEVEVKEKVLSRHHFFGLKVKRRVLRLKRIGGKRVKEVFYHLKKKHVPVRPPYVPYVYWYHLKDRKIIYSRRYNKEEGYLLHGRYVRKVGKKVVDERYFYHGVRHGRWTQHNLNNILLSKSHYYKGWSREAEKRYYDLAQTRLKEVIPIQYGSKEGFYYAFHPNGNIAVVGRYIWDHRVGVWKEFYTSGKAKREIHYNTSPYDDSASFFTPYIAMEWSFEGRLLYFHEGLRDRGTEGLNNGRNR